MGDWLTWKEKKKGEEKGERMRTRVEKNTASYIETVIALVPV